MTEEEYQKKMEQFHATLKEMKDYSESQFDKLIISISSGAIGVSLAFLKDIRASATHEILTLLKISLVAFALAIVSILLSHYTAIKVVESEDSEDEKNSDLFNYWTKMLNNSSIVSVVVGILFIAIFICYIT